MKQAIDFIDHKIQRSVLAIARHRSTGKDDDAAFADRHQLFLDSLRRVAKVLKAADRLRSALLIDTSADSPVPPATGLPMAPIKAPEFVAAIHDLPEDRPFLGDSNTTF
jgi:hypothetical protein